MSAVHRPLSDWVARLVPPRPDTAMPTLDVINDGAERSDARAFPMFESGWVRRSVTVADRGGRVHAALALCDPETHSTIVELDGYGVPLPVTEAGLDLVDSIERSWPTVKLSDGELAVLGSEAPELRFLLLSRLAREGHPPARLYHVLPWSLVDDLARAAMTRLGGGVAPDPTPPRHLLTPALPGVTGPLEQLHQGLVDLDRELARAGATAFCTGLGEAELARIPPSTVTTLAELLEMLSRFNPLLRHRAAVVVDRLIAADVRHREFTLDLDPGLPAAASAGGPEGRHHTESARDDSPLAVSATVTAGGRLTVVVEVAIKAGKRRDELLDSYRTAFYPITIDSTERRDRYWVPLVGRSHSLAGVLELRAPRQRFQVHAEGLPVGVWELGRVDAQDLLPSLRAADNAGAEIWQGLANRLPADHPIALARSALDN
jgi:hypothetical protein